MLDHHIPTRVNFWGACLTSVILVVLLLPTAAFALTPIARFDVVPYQRIEHASSFKVGVVAFSKPGIASVVFNAAGQGYNGGAKTVTAMTLNDQSGVWEYWTTFSANEFSGNGAVTITARVTDKGGNTRDLTLSMIAEGASAFTPVTAWVSAGGNNTTCTVNNESSPCLTIAGAITKIQAANGGNSNGAIIYLEEGTYSVASVSASTTNEWLTITKDDTAAVENVIINTGQLSTGYLKYDSVTLQSRGTNLYVADNTATRLWTNNCRRIGSGRWVANSNPVHFSNETNHYSTNDYTYDSDYGYRKAALVRGAKMEKIGDDAFENTGFVVNCTLDDQDNGDTGVHSDVYQAFTGLTGSEPAASNRIIYNYKATNVHIEGIFMRVDVGGPAKDNAFVNVFIEFREPPGPNELGLYSFANGINNAFDHLLFWNCTIIGGEHNANGTLTNSSFIGNVFYAYNSYESEIGVPSIPSAAPDNTSNNQFLNNHFYQVYNETAACTPNSKYIQQNWPCPHRRSKRPDSDLKGSATKGDWLLDLSNPAIPSFGIPIDGSPLINRFASVVPVDLNNNPRGTVSDVGAIENVNITSPLPLSVPSGFQLVAPALP